MYEHTYVHVCIYPGMYVGKHPRVLAFRCSLLCIFKVYHWPQPFQLGRGSPGIDLFLPLQCWDYKHILPCMVLFYVGLGA